METVCLRVLFAMASPIVMIRQMKVDVPTTMGSTTSKTID